MPIMFVNFTLFFLKSVKRNNQGRGRGGRENPRHPSGSATIRSTPTHLLRMSSTQSELL